MLAVHPLQILIPHIEVGSAFRLSQALVSLGSRQHVDAASHCFGTAVQGTRRLLSTGTQAKVRAACIVGTVEPTGPKMQACTWTRVRPAWGIDMPVHVALC